MSVFTYNQLNSASLTELKEAYEWICFILMTEPPHLKWWEAQAHLERVLDDYGWQMRYSEHDSFEDDIPF